MNELNNLTDNRMKLRVTVIVLFAAVFCFVKMINAQSLRAVPVEISRGDYHRILFYNVENLFDTCNDSLTNDDDFLPGGIRNWTKYRYSDKLNKIAKVVIAAGGWKPPEIIGLCEIENRQVIEDLLKNTPLLKAGYKIVHKESPDERGIDVALLYSDKKVKPLSYKAIPVVFPWDMANKTREILYFKALIAKHDTIHFFVNHWPSRYGGQAQTEKLRMTAAKVLRNHVDSLFRKNTSSNIIIMGDFNDEPTDKSLIEGLKAHTSYNYISDTALYNLSFPRKQDGSIGTHKYDGSWTVLDQFIVSGNLLDSIHTVHTTQNDYHILNADFLLEDDNINTGNKPNRIYTGYTYHGGFSDHLPVYIDIFLKQ